MAVLPPIDAHAHVPTDVDERDLRALRSTVFAMTSTPSEWSAALGRRDDFCVWGLGCHPQVHHAAVAFDAERLSEAVEHTPLIGEVGLDGRSQVPMPEQRRVFRATLAVAKSRSRLVSIHSVRASALVLDELEEAGGVPGAILHWWRGSQRETLRAIDLGCYFSLNGAEATQPKVIAALPAERVLTETDFPYTEHSDHAADRPGAVVSIEAALTDVWSVSGLEVRRRLWKNLATLCAATRTSNLMPRGIQGHLLTAL